MGNANFKIRAILSRGRDDVEVRGPSGSEHTRSGCDKIDFPNVVVTSHQAFLTHEALGNIADTTLANIAEFESGKRGADLTNVDREG